ncbi:hypothetical protein R1sor_027116 [Riccia sorocarpa]|uniref:MULE transposase domain-containing protein n=1 Tax=Riccia sorocarpa TaxID=122646 RepID=A0ABD3GE11_9MARC
MDGVEIMDGSDIEETIFTPGEMIVEEWEFFNDFTQRRNTPAFPAVRPDPDRPDLNLEEHVFSQCTQRRKKRVGVKGGCGEKDRYDAAQMVCVTHADSDGEDLDEENIEDDEEDCDDDLKKAAVDGNNQIVILAYAVAPTENYENWRWFLQNLVASIEGLESPNVIIVSNRQKGLEKAVAEMLPMNHHMHCAHHLKMNVQKHFGVAATNAFCTLVYMNSQAIYERRLVQMETRVSKGAELVQYIRQIPMDRYVRFAIPCNSQES